MKNKISKRLVICALISTAVFVAVTVCVCIGLFYRKSDGEDVTFPDYVGSYEEDIPTDTGFELQKNYTHSDTHPRGAVISQYPEGLAVKKVKTGSTPRLTLNISLGRESFVLDGLSGRTLTEAKSYLREHFCTYKTVRIYGDFDAETVVRTLPAEDTEISVGDRVVLYVNTPTPKEYLKVPDVVGLDIERAAALLREQGFIFECCEGFDANYDTWAVISQSEIPHTYKEKSTVIKITVNTD